MMYNDSILLNDGINTETISKKHFQIPDLRNNIH